MDRNTPTARETGERVRAIARNADLESPETPIVPVSRGDGVGRTVVPAAQRVLETAAHVVDRRVHWLPVSLGAEGQEQHGEPLPAESLEVLREFTIGLIGPTGSHNELIRPLRTWLRYELGCHTTVVRASNATDRLRPASSETVGNLAVVYDTIDGLSPELECPPGSEGAERARQFAIEGLADGVTFGDGSLGVGIRPLGRATTERVVDRAINEAHETSGGRLTFVHQDGRLPHTDGAARDWAYELAREREDVVTDRSASDGETERNAVLDDQHLESVLDQLHDDPGAYEVLAAPPFAGRVLARTAVGVAGGPGTATTCHTGNGRLLAMPAHGPRPDADPEGADPTATILAGRELFRSIGWTDAATLLTEALEVTFDDGVAPRNAAAGMDESTPVSTEAFVDRVVTALEERGPSATNG